MCFLSCSGECGDAAGIGDAESAARGESLSALGKAGLQLAPAMCKSQWVPQHSVQEASRLIDWDAHHQRHPSFIPTSSSSSSCLFLLRKHMCFSPFFFFFFYPDLLHHTQQASLHPLSTNKKVKTTHHTLMDLTEIEHAVFLLLLLFFVCFFSTETCAWVLNMRSVSIAGFIQGNTFAVITDERPFSTRY